MNARPSVGSRGSASALLLALVAACNSPAAPPPGADPVLVTEIELRPKHRLCLEYVDFSYLPALSPLATVATDPDLRLSAEFVIPSELGELSVAWFADGNAIPVMNALVNERRYKLLFTPAYDARKRVVGMSADLSYWNGSAWIAVDNEPRLELSFVPTPARLARVGTGAAFEVAAKNQRATFWFERP